MGSYHVEGNVALFEQPNQKRTGDTKQIRRPLSRQFLMFRDDAGIVSNLASNIPQSK
jgi:hypothetical protein